MATVVELADQRLEGPDSGQRTYRVTETDSAGTAQALAYAAADAVWNGLIRQTPNVEELGGDCWDAIVPYRPYQPGDTNDTEWSFQIRTETLHITKGEDHIATYPSTPTNDPWHGAINVRHDVGGGTPDGVDILVPVFTWEETHYVSPAIITPTYLQTLEGIVARTNHYAFRIWQPQELLLLGVSARGNNRATNAIPLTFAFGCSRTRVNFTVLLDEASQLITEKKGWHYLWYEYQQSKATDGTVALGTVPIRAHIEQVYRTANYSLLGLADPWSSP